MEVMILDKKLTPRETEVMRLIARGDKTPQIALELSISTRTVETHRANIKRKFGLDAARVRQTKTEDESK